MMLKWVTNRLQGQVQMEVEAVYPERLLNLCSSRGIQVWDVVWMDSHHFLCHISATDYRRLRDASKGQDWTICTLKCLGLPYFLWRFRHRWALTIGLGLAVILLIASSFFVWDIQIEGCETVPEETILRVLEQHGISIGTYGFSVDSVKLRNEMLLEIPELSWISVNVYGYQARVQVRERVAVPDMVDKTQASNVVARCDGLIMDMEPLDGRSEVRRGTTVTEGQLLISGITELGNMGVSIGSGRGSVTARTWMTYETMIPLTVEEKVYDEKEEIIWSLICGRNRIKFAINSSIPTGNYDKMVKTEKLSLFGLLPLPLTLTKETIMPYETVTVTKTVEEATAEGEAVLQEYLQSQVMGTVSSTLCQGEVKDGYVLVTLRCECLEEIGVTVPIEVEMTVN